MHTTQRITAAAAAALLFAATPAGATSHEPAPPTEPPAQMQGPPPSTHGKFIPAPEGHLTPYTAPLCDSEVTFTPEPVEPLRYRVLVTEDGDTVVETRGTSAVDIVRDSDGATLEDVELDFSAIETLYGDGTTFTIDRTGPALVIVTDEVEVEVLAEAGLPQAFIFLSGHLKATITLESESGTNPGEPPAVVSAQLEENTTEYVFDVCHLLDQAAAGEEALAP